MREGRASTSADTVADPLDRWRQRVFREGAVSGLVVSASPSLQDRLARLLEDDGLAVRVDPTGAALREPACPFDLVLIDADLRVPTPSLLLRSTRVRSRVPLVVVAGQQPREQVLVDLYSSGADQVVTSDRHNELSARVRAILRGTPPQDRSAVHTHAGAAGLVLDLATGVLTLAERTIALTHREADLLATLLSRAGRIVSRDRLAGVNRTRTDDHALDALVRSLRNKLEEAEGRRRIIAVRGLGFRLLVDEAELAANDLARRGWRPPSVIVGGTDLVATTAGAAAPSEG